MILALAITETPSGFTDDTKLWSQFISNIEQFSWSVLILYA